MSFIVTLLFWVGVTAIDYLLRPKRPRPERVLPEEFQGITAEQGRPIPVVWGTRCLKSANVGWWGDLQVVDLGGGKFDYRVGVQYLLCVGPIDRLVRVRVADKDVPSAAIVVDAANDAIAFSNGGATQYRSIAHATYENPDEIAMLFEDLMRPVLSDWWVGYGFAVRPESYVPTHGSHDVFRFATKFSGVWTSYSATLRAGYYTADQLADEIERACAAEIGAEYGTVTASYNAGTHKFTIVFSPAGGGYESFMLPIESTDTQIMRSTHPLLGFRTGSQYEGTTLTSAFAVYPYRYIFDGSGNLRLEDAGFTAAALLGLTTGASVAMPKVGDSDKRPTGTSRYPNEGGCTFDFNSGSFLVNQLDLFGQMDVYYGSDAQVPNAYMERVLATTLPAYRHIAYAVSRRMSIGWSPYPPTMSFVIERFPNTLGLSAGQERIGSDANAAAMLWDLLNDDTWGLGLPEAALDKDAFLAAGAALSGEAFGLGGVQDAIASGSEIAGEILRHIDGVLRIDPFTGLASLMLARADYNVPDLPLIDDTIADSCRLTRPSWESTRNVVRVSYADEATGYTEAIAEAMDTASIESSGFEAIEQMNYPLVSTASNAHVIAGRALKALAHPAAQIELNVNRSAWQLRQGDPFRLTWAAYSVTNLPCRVTRVSQSDLEDGKIVVDAVEDMASE